MSAAAQEHPSGSGLGLETSTADPRLAERFRAELRRLRAEATENDAWHAHLAQMEDWVERGGVVHVVGRPDWAAPTPEQAGERRASAKVRDAMVHAAGKQGVPPEMFGFRPHLEAFEELRRRHPAAS